MKISVFWDTTAYNPVKVNCRCRGTFHLHFRVDENAKQDPSTKQAASRVLSAETTADFNSTTQLYITEGRTLHSY
jgi:hypothetical protein